MGDVVSDDAIDVIPELSGGASCSPSIPAVVFLGDLLVGVEFSDFSRSSSGVLCRNLLGEADSFLRGRPRPLFTVVLPSLLLTRSGSSTGRCAGDDCPSCLFACDELEEATIISSSSSCRGMRFFGIVNDL